MALSVNWRWFGPNDPPYPGEPLPSQLEAIVYHAVFSP